MESAQRPLELILARNLLSSISTPALLVSREGDLLFYNEAAGMLLGRRFEEKGRMSADEATRTFGPLDARGEPIPNEEQPLTLSLRDDRPAHATHQIRSADGAVHRVEVSGVPIMGSDGAKGGMIFFWRADE